MLKYEINMIYWKKKKWDLMLQYNTNTLLSIKMPIVSCTIKV